MSKSKYIGKVDIFWEGHNILRNLHRRFDRYDVKQIYGGLMTSFNLRQQRKIVFSY